MNRPWNEKSLILVFVFIGIFFLAYSCSDKDGDWDDNIKLSKKEARFHMLADSTIFTTEGEGWWFSEVSFNGVYQDLEDLDTTEDSFEIVKDEFVIRRNSKTELFVKMEENLSGDERLLRIGLQGGNYFDGVEITQDKE